jgi:hypothetical protein
MISETNERSDQIIFAEARSCIEAIKDLEMRMFLKAVYLLCAAGDEMAGKISSASVPSRKMYNVVYGPKGTDVSQTIINMDVPEFDYDIVTDFLEQLSSKDFNADRFVQTYSRKVPIALFAINTAKQGKNGSQEYRQGKEKIRRIVALPLLQNIEPWTKDLYDYFTDKGDRYVFPFTRQKVDEYISKNNVFKGKYYKIRRYNFYDDNSKKSEWTPEHKRRLVVYGLRSLRNDELIERYGFNLLNIETYTGMTIRHQTRIPVQAEQLIANSDWHSYVEKLCNPKRTSLS